MPELVLPHNIQFLVVMLNKKDEKQDFHLLHSTKILCNGKLIFNNQGAFVEHQGSGKSCGNRW